MNTDKDTRAEPPVRRASEAFFGRRRGKPVREAARSASERLLPERRLDLDLDPPVSLAALFPVAVDQVRLEIGFGAGERLMSEAERFPGTGFLGVEPFVNGMSRFLHALDSDPLPNIRVYDDDAVRLLDWLPTGGLDGIDLFYPDPWPKKKHWKRRFVNPANLDRFARVLRPGARFRFASDIEHYVNWTLRLAEAHPAFAWVADHPSHWRLPYENWRSTRYEEKALREGRTPAYLTFERLAAPLHSHG